MAVPFMDLGRANAEIREPFLAEVEALLDSGAFTNGPAVGEFESEFAAWCGASSCVGVASGLDALRLGLIAGGIEPGDEVVAPAHTFVATIEAIEQAGCKAVLADVSEVDYGLDPAATEAALSSATTCLMPVHLYGQLADMAALEATAGRNGLLIVEDACQAHGATRDGRRAGTAGMAGGFSFYPGKNLGAFGDAGALVTDDEALAARVRSLREHGERRKYEHALVGYTARLDTIQAIALRHKLPLLTGWNDERRRAAALYSEALAGTGDLRLPPVAEASDPVWHLYVVRTADPEALAGHLRERGIATGRHYPAPIHLNEAYGRLGDGPGSFPVAEALAAEGLSLPIFPGITEAEIEAVTDAIGDHFASPRRAP